MATVIEAPGETISRKAARPTIAERARERICPNCGGPAERRNAKGPAPTFCDAKGKGVCKKEHSARKLAEGYAMAAWVKAWRIDRGTGEIAKGSLAQLCEIAGLFNAQDLEAGRPRADLYAAKLLAEQTRYLDRRAHR